MWFLQCIAVPMCIVSGMLTFGIGTTIPASPTQLALYASGITQVCVGITCAILGASHETLRDDVVKKLERRIAQLEEENQ